MTVVLLLAIGVLTGLTTVLFGFGGGFATVPAVLWADAAAGPAASTVAVATSSLVMVVNAAVATAATPKSMLTGLRQRLPLLALLGAGGLAGAAAATFAPPELISWGFVLYLAATLVDVLVRPGFLSPAHDGPAGDQAVAVPASLGMPIGSLASFLGVGGSVLTVPLLRRSGLPMAAATALANPLTLCISAPACALFLTRAPAAGDTVDTGALLLAAGSVDLGAVALLLLGAVPVVVLLRRRPPRIADRLHARGYVALLALVLTAMLLRLRTG
ncbi:sulfite exporter TauE/SafE family protein [Streptomyces murinus]|uniref:sulfite exporter TauE/SafE family protein n=1 Tax=Streptomyces murinus TaxID=33900 RepID=UPI002E0F3AC0|nr:sulfite exporter TauE/SafE family protein [Streptomyces murinus]